MGGSIFPCFILLMVSSVTQGTSDHHSCEKTELFQEKLTPFILSLKDQWNHLACTWNPVQRLGRACMKLAGVIFALLFPFLKKKKKKRKVYPHHRKFALGKSVTIYWKEELKVRGSCLRQFYY